MTVTHADTQAHTQIMKAEVLSEHFKIKQVTGVCAHLCACMVYRQGRTDALEDKEEQVRVSSHLTCSSLGQRVKVQR